MSVPRANIEPIEHWAIQEQFAEIADSADPTGWMGEDELMEPGAIEEMISSGELSLSAGQAGY